MPEERVIRNMQVTVASEERRRALRRLDDILEALEQLNLHDESQLSDFLVERLSDLGIDDPGQHSVPRLIELVWERQQPYLITLTVDRRRRRRRRSELDVPTWSFPGRA